MDKTLSQSDYVRAAEELGVPVAAVKAVTEVESRGSGFLPDGRPLVLFERHIMFRRVRDKFGSAKAVEMSERYPSLINATPGGYGKTSEQPERMGKAAGMIDRDCALESASWGLFQIMGYHWKLLGYESLQKFVNAMYRSEGDQLDAFVRFVKANPVIHKALKAQDWQAFAAGFNGPNYRDNQYDTKLEAAFAQHSTAQEQTA